MKIDITSLKEEFEKSITNDKKNHSNTFNHFDIHEKQIEDETVYLIHSRIGTVWSQNKLIFRSSVWNKDGNLISASFRKFFNWDEQPNLDPKPNSLSGCQLIEKIDGSTLIISKYKNHIITRTRDTINLSMCNNSDEIEYFKKTYPKVFEIEEDQSYLYEWVSPKNKIVLNFDKPDLYLIAVINHLDYSMWSQEKLDNLALTLKVKRPKIFKFSSISEMIETVKEFKGIEGICVYYNHGQNIRKIKSAEYLLLHHFKNNLNLENVLELYLKFNCPKYNDFINLIAKEFDWECIQYIQGFASRICDASTEVNKIIDTMKKFADSVKILSRKDAAEKIIFAYGKTSRSGFVFLLLNNQEIDKKGLKKLYIQILGHL